MDQLISEISLSLSQLAKIEAYRVLQEEQFIEATNAKKIAFLDMLEFTRDEIASLVGTTPGTVTKELSLLRKADSYSRVH